MYLYTALEDNFALTAIYSAFGDMRTADYYGKGEAHDFWELVIVTEGEIGATAGKNVHYLKKGEAILHAPGEFHNLWSEKNERSGIIIFSFSAKEMPVSASCTLRVSDLQRPREILAQIEHCFHKHKIWVQAVREGQELAACMAIKRLELFLLELLATKDTQRHAGSTPQSARHFAEVVRYLEENVSLSLTVAQIAAACNLGEVNLKKIFSRYAGMGVMSYFTRLKIRAAVALLEQGVSVREASDALGFVSQNYFCTVFTRIMGKSPKNFKG
ncbi:MAG: helix-turn-helix transcriptional regulator [Clostridia bacterium]|nr:helix-turn-helix transcriptional regulator [Clostridia bacterium]